MIKIKAFFSDWKEVSLEEAVSFAKNIMNLHKPEVFSKHYQGISYEELEAARKCYKD